MNNTKSAMTAGALGILLGVFGAHDWYLGDVQQARKHVRLLITGVAMLAVAIVLRMIAPATGQLVIAHILTSIAAIFNVFGWLVLLADFVWGLIAGILLLVGGDRALAGKGYIVAQRDANGNIIPTSTPVFNPTLPVVNSPASQPQSLAQPTSMPTMPMTQASATNVAPQSSPTLTQTPSAQNPIQIPTAVPTQSSVQPASMVQPSVQATTSSQPSAQATDTAQPTMTPRVTLPPAPTLAEQGSNTQVDQPVVFHASDIPTHSQSAFGPNQPASPIIPTGPIVTENAIRPGVTIKKDYGRIPVWAQRTIIGAIIIGSLALLFVMIKGGVDSTISVAYQEAYRAAKALLPEIKTAHDSSSCTYAVEYAQASSVDRATYNGYIATCKQLLTGTRELVDQLGETSIVHTNSEISAEYDTFRTAYDSVFVDEATAAEISSTLDLYQTWHTYLLLADHLTVTSSDREFQQAADTLRTSGNQTLANYGEEWLRRELDYLAAYRAYQAMSYTDPEKESTRAALDAQLVELEDWVSDHRPSVTKLAPYAAPDTTAMYQSFTKLYEAIKAGYESHYDRSSKDCTVAGDKVYCQ